MKEKLSFTSFLKVEPHIAYQTPIHNCEKYGKMNSFKHAQNYPKLYQGSKDESTPNSWKIEDFSSALEKEFALRQSNRLNTSKLSIIGSSISKEVANQDERYIIASRHSRASFHAPRVNPIEPSSKCKQVEGGTCQKPHINLLSNTQNSRKDSLNIFASKSPRTQKNIRPKYKKSKKFYAKTNLDFSKANMMNDI